MDIYLTVYAIIKDVDKSAVGLSLHTNITALFYANGSVAFASGIKLVIDNELLFSN